MAPTLEPGEIAWFEKANEKGLPQRGQVVAVTIAEFHGAVVPSRVVGLPGEFVQLRNGDLLVNHARVPEPYIQSGRAEQDFSQTSEPAIVPEGHVWLLGDFRDVSKDSRTLGPLPMSSILGTVLQAHAPGEHANPRRVR